MTALTEFASDGKGHLTPNQKSTDESRYGATVWFTGLSGSGKSTLLSILDARLKRAGWVTQTLDADTIRHQLFRDLGFSKVDRIESCRRLAYIARLLTDCGVTALVAAMSPYEVCRKEARASSHEFVEVYVDAPLAVCQARDPTGLYERLRCGTIRNVSGVDMAYEIPANPDVHCRTDLADIGECVDKIFRFVNGLRE